MKPISVFLVSLLLVLVTITCVRGQTGKTTVEQRPAGEGTAGESPGEPILWIYLIDGRRFQVDEVIERSNGFWFKRANVSTFLERTQVTRVERVAPIKPAEATESLRSASSWKISDSVKVERFFMNRFGRSLPLGAFGQSYLHTRWGLDHRNGMDVSLHPDSTEGKALMSFLRNEGIPFLGFRGPIPGVATGPHIHIGNPSPRSFGRK
jgi:hypothetical protein